MPPKRGKKAATAAKPALDGCVLALSGTFPGTTHGAIKARAEALGATVESTVTDKTTHLVASVADYEKQSTKVAKAKTLDLHIVGLEWLSLCEQNNSREPEKDHALGASAATNNSQQADASQANGTSTTKSGSRKRAPTAAADNDADDGSGTAAPKAKRTRGSKAAAAAPVKEEDEDTEMKDANDTAEPEPEVKEESKKKSKKERAMGEGQVAKSKDIRIPLDEGCSPIYGQVYIDDSGVIYDASLNQTNASANNNKFYRIQLLVDSHGQYRTWTRWGRVGERGQTHITSPSLLDGAMRVFEKKFKDKSGLSWADRGKDPKPGKYAFIERNYEESDDEDSDDDEKAAGSSDKKDRPSDWKPPQSKLEPAVQELVKLIFNQQYFDAAMSSLNYDANKLPLGKLSKATITRGFQALKDLAALINDPSVAATIHNASYNAAVEQLSNTFYSLIPHAFGRNRPPVISSEGMLKREIELLESLSDMKDAALIMKLEKANDDVHPLDKQYDGLGMREMTPLDPESTEFKQLQEYLFKTRGATHGHSYKVENIFRIERKGEYARFDDSVFGKMHQNRRLLWHGSRVTNFGGILSQGLRIAPPEAPVSGYMFGKGIYLADMASKSANYCCSYISGGTALLLLCEAELGDPMQELVNASYNAGEDAKKKGMIATWGKGQTGPLKWKDAGCVHPSLAGVMMPDTSVTPGNTNVDGAYLYYNEYIAYDVSQVRLRYLFRIKILDRRNTCVTCRARKVRCDGRQGICTNCERLGFGCSYDESVGVEVVGPGESNGPTAISVPRRRVRQACQTCHARKARCSGSLPSCDRCRAQGIECVYRPGKRSLPMQNLAQATSPTSGTGPMDVDAQAGQNPPNDYGASAVTASPGAAGGSDFPQMDLDETLVLKAFDNFFRHVHHVAVFSFLHRPSLMERYHAGSLDRALVLSIVGIASLLTDLGPGMVAYGNRCVDEAVNMCLAGLEKPTIARLQALVLATKHRILSKRFSSAFMLHAIASRFATALRLSHENPNLCFLARESRRRVMWSIYMIDVSLSTGQADVALWPYPDRQIQVQLPCNERNFDFDLPEPTEPLQSPGPDAAGVIPPLPDVLGLMALHIRLYWLRTRISECTSRATASPPPETLALLPGQLAEFAAELDLFDARLPASFRENEANFRLRSYSQRLGIFVMTHLLRRQCNLDLSRIFLPGLRESLPSAVLDGMDPLFVMHKRHSCYEHARAMADMFSQLLSLSGNKPPVADLDLPGCAFQCVRVLYHGLQTDNAALGFTQERVRELATVCLRAARLSTGGPASASIQADIERIIDNGLSLPEVPPVPEADSMTLMTPTPPASRPIDQPRQHLSPVQMSTMGPPIAPLSMPMTEAPVSAAAAGVPNVAAIASPSAAAAVAAGPAGVAPSQASALTSASNAFEEAAQALNFGQDFFGMELWSAGLPDGWNDMGQFAGGGIS
ncbi:hypothetical protein VTJ49DRAFT_1875 [Mycothermus thermophilus]|uniref:Poly [ADP-ribose] polymerase n=1 Tax=Humicola insolens TaxID=85995 RepID=A0ABR3VBL9_HUMIN